MTKESSLRLPSDECQWTLLMTSQHWFRQWSGAIILVAQRHKAVIWSNLHIWLYGPLTRNVKLRVAHVPGMPGMLSPPPRVSDPDMHHGTCVTHVPRCMPWSQTGGFLWSQWRGKRSRHSRCMPNAQFYVSGEKSIARSSHVYQMFIIVERASTRKIPRHPDMIIFRGNIFKGT